MGRRIPLRTGSALRCIRRPLPRRACPAGRRHRSCHSSVGRFVHSRTARCRRRAAPGRRACTGRQRRTSPRGKRSRRRRSVLGSSAGWHTRAPDLRRRGCRCRSRSTRPSRSTVPPGMLPRRLRSFADRSRRSSTGRCRAPGPTRTEPCRPPGRRAFQDCTRHRSHRSEPDWSPCPRTAPRIPPARAHSRRES